MKWFWTFSEPIVLVICFAGRLYQTDFNMNYKEVLLWLFIGAAVWFSFTYRLDEGREDD